MNKKTALFIVLSIIIVVLFIIVAVDESELRNLKADNANLTEKIETLENEKTKLDEQMQVLTDRIEQLESENSAPEYVYHNSYYDSDYDGLTDQEYIAQRESGQDYNARNGRYIGKYQLDESMLNGDYSPENQEYMAEQYMLDRYGSWENAREFWDSHGWW